ncbi:MAG: hypothetical protein GY820_26870 [Gammaproteobacteria bacterium]|nr:hypothetical protein [Gammaproteobacteria bacterium]
MTVIVSIIISIPLIGYYLAVIILPSYNIGINRLFSFHYLNGFIINYLILIHILVLHTFSSSNPIINSSSTNIHPFIIYTINKDTMLIVYFSLLFLYFIVNDILANTDNNIMANAFHTPNNILPE